MSLANGDAALLQKLSVAPGVEIRSSKSLTLGSEWNLAPTSAQRVGEAANITLRAAGDLIISNSLSDGFAASASATDKRAIAANGLAMSGSAASFRLIAGADLRAADPMTVQSAAATGHVLVGRTLSSGNAAPPLVLVRSSTGSIRIAAAGDIRLGADLDDKGRDGQVRIYTTGTAVAAADTPGLDQLRIRANDQLIRNTSGSLGPFFENAGDINLSAGRDVLGMPSTIYRPDGSSSSVQYVSDWWFRQTNPTSSEQGVALWSRYDLFAQGIASFGGGDVKVQAGRDVVDLDVSTPNSGYSVKAVGQQGAADYKPAQQRWFEGGSLSVEAGRDVLGGLFNAGGATAALTAGNQVRGSSQQERSYLAPQLFYMDTAWNINAMSHLWLGNLTQTAAMAGGRQGIDVASRTDAIEGLAAKASAKIVSVAGDLRVGSGRPSSLSGTNPGSAATLMPDELLLAAPSGGIKASSLAQLPVGAASLQLMARDGVEVESFKVASARLNVGDGPRPVTQAELGDVFNVYRGHWTRADGGLDASDRSPVRVVSSDGDVVLGSLASYSARPIRLLAGGDVLAAGPLQLQHNRSDELSLLQAGRDLRLSSLGGVRVGGPGDLLLLAGRDIDMNRGTGVLTVGNQDNSRLLPNGGSHVTLMAGTQMADLSQAVAQQFHLIGGGLEHFAPELAVQLKALLQSGQVLTPQAAKDAAKAFAALPVAEQREQVRVLVGDSVLSSASETYLQKQIALAESVSADAAAAIGSGKIGGADREPGVFVIPGSELAGKPISYRKVAQADATLEASSAHPVLTAEQVELAAADTRGLLREALQSQTLGAALAAKVQSLDPDSRQSLLLAVSPYTEALTRFVNQRGLVAADAAAAYSAFSQLGQDQQALFLTQVLGQELREAGRSAISGSKVAYLRGYQALDTLFPPSKSASVQVASVSLGQARPNDGLEALRRDGNIVLSNSQVKTAQGGDIRFVAPSGTLNVGDLLPGGNARDASDLGIVTVAGGDIVAAVRNSVEVNQSRIFTLAKGDVMLWASLGNLDAGRGAKTVLGSPPPVYSINSQGQFVVDTSGSFSGSGIAVLDAASSLDLYAALGDINAGDAGIKTAGNAFLGATRLVGGDNVAVGGKSDGVALPSTSGPATISTPLSPAATAAGNRDAQNSDDEDERRKKRPRRNLFLDFLGFGQGD
ncbi:filamentous hemagglutinin family protein [Roseateles sp.]|uniref:filamentous haemagglutinin family protein n=1 Tax=Roseateles sp. TaxID=1971397 RepID=UPI003BA7B723